MVRVLIINIYCVDKYVLVHYNVIAKVFFWGSCG